MQNVLNSNRPVSVELASLLRNLDGGRGPILPASPSLAHLVPQRSFGERVGDFFRTRPAVQILTFGAGALALSEALKPGMHALFSATDAGALLVEISSAVIPYLGLAVVLQERQRPEEELSGDATLSALASGVAGAWQPMWPS